MYYAIRCKKHLTQADVAELVDALDLGSSIFDVRVRVSPSAFISKQEKYRDTCKSSISIFFLFFQVQI